MTRKQWLSTAGAAAVVLVVLPAVMATVVTREVLTPSPPPAAMQASPAGIVRKPLVAIPAEVAHFVEHDEGREAVLRECGTRDRIGPECAAAEEARRFVLQEGIEHNNEVYRRRMAEICAREPGEPKPALLCE